MSKEDSVIADLTGITGKWSLVVVFMVLTAAVAVILGCIGLLVRGDENANTKEMFEQCISAGNVWVDGNCLPKSEVQG